MGHHPLYYCKAWALFSEISGRVAAKAGIAVEGSVCGPATEAYRPIMVFHANRFRKLSDTFPSIYFIRLQGAVNERMFFPRSLRR